MSTLPLAKSPAELEKIFRQKRDILRSKQEHDAKTTLTTVGRFTLVLIWIWLALNVSFLLMMIFLPNTSILRFNDFRGFIIFGILSWPAVLLEVIYIGGGVLHLILYIFRGI